MGMLPNIGIVSNPGLIVLVFFMFFRESWQWAWFAGTILLLVILTMDSWGILNLIFER